jgi:hypothetical protein
MDVMSVCPCGRIELGGFEGGNVVLEGISPDAQGIENARRQLGISPPGPIGVFDTL